MGEVAGSTIDPKEATMQKFKKEVRSNWSFYGEHIQKDKRAKMNITNERKKMKNVLPSLILAVALVVTGYGQDKVRLIPEDEIEHLIEKLTSKFEKEDADRIKRGVNHVASLWLEDDGSRTEFHG